MGLASRAAIAAAERVERTGGARAGLAVWRTMADTAVEVETRAVALLSAMRCAIELRDAAVLETLATSWQGVKTGIWDEMFERIRRAAAAGMTGAAVSLARAEAARHRSARSLHAYARALEVSGDAARAEPVFAEAALRADKEGAHALANASRLRRAVILSAWPSFEGAALEEARRVDAAEAPVRDRLALARILLRSPSRFVRTGAIDLLDPILSGEDAVLAEAALVLCATHADDAGDTLTPMEADRLLALFKRPAVEKRAARARAALEVVVAFARARAAGEGPARDAALDAAMTRASALDPALAQLHARARDLVSGRFEPHAAAPFELPASRAVGEEAWRDAWAAVLDLAFALRDGANARASHVLRALRTHALAEAGRHPLPANVWIPLASALASTDAEVKAAAVALAEVLLASPSRKAPPRGWLGVAGALALAGREDLGELARRAAVQQSEPGAAAALATALTRSAWQLALTTGERSRALALLREARALSEATGGSPAARPPLPPSKPPAPGAPPADAGTTPSR